MSTPEPNFYVSPPILPLAQKRQYLPAKDIQSLKEDARVDEVIGEYFDDKKEHFYFARYAGGIAHKVSLFIMYQVKLH
jgi:chromodomain-helicase-DNA-binding protein 4